MIDSIGIDSIWASLSDRKMYYASSIDDYDAAKATMSAPPMMSPLEKANLISSEVEPDKHKPVIDFDFPTRVIPSSTEGHGHLYIEKELTWAQYKALLDGLLAAGLIQEGWYKSAIKDKRTYVRLPHVVKRDAAEKQGRSKDLGPDWSLRDEPF